MQTSSAIATLDLRHPDLIHAEHERQYAEELAAYYDCWDWPRFPAHLDRFIRTGELRRFQSSGRKLTITIKGDTSGFTAAINRVTNSFLGTLCLLQDIVRPSAVRHA